MREIALSELFPACDSICGTDNEKCKNTFVSRIEHDFRKTRPGELYVCLPASDDFEIEAAYAAGTRVFLCENDARLPDDAVIIRTADVKVSTAESAALFYGRPAEHIKLIAFCGSAGSGKTSSALLFCGIMEKLVSSSANIGSDGVVVCGELTENFISSSFESIELHHALSLLHTLGTEYAAVEITEELFEKEVFYGLEFETVVYLDSQCAKYNVVGKFKAYVSEKNGEATASLKVGDRGVMISSTNARTDRKNNFIGQSFTAIVEKKDLDSSVCLLESSFNVFVPSPSAEIVRFASAAAISAISQGAAAEDVFELLQHVTVPGRMEVIPGEDSGTVFIIDRAYTGDMLERALCSVRPYVASSGKLICVFGAAGERYKERRRGLAEAASKLSDLSIITEENPDFESPDDIAAELASYYGATTEYKIINDREQAVRYAVREASCGDAVLFAGKGLENYQLKRGIKRRFIEREIIRDETLAIKTENLWSASLKKL